MYEKIPINPYYLNGCAAKNKKNQTVTLNELRQYDVDRKGVLLLPPQSPQEHDCQDTVVYIIFELMQIVNNLVLLKWENCRIKVKLFWI